MKTLKRRRFEGKTDYKARLALLKSGKPRLVIRKTNKYIVVQLVRSEGAQDFVVSSVSSHDLPGTDKKNNGLLRNRAAAYTAGFLLGSKIKGKVKEAILDIGMHRNVHKSRIYAALKGALDAGLVVPHDPEALPSMETIHSNKKMTDILNKIIGKEAKHG